MRIAVAGLVALAACGSRAPAPQPSDPRPVVGERGALRSPSAFASIADTHERSRAMFVEISRVLLHPRCANCHPADDTPRQGDAQIVHDPPVVRGPRDFGVPAMQCATCHQDRNLELARVPGAPGWHLAPADAAWIGRTPAQVCAQLVDPKRNGGRTLARVHDHIAHDELVAWAWSPGADRVPALGSQAELGALVQAWIDAGAECPP